MRAGSKASNTGFKFSSMSNNLPSFCSIATTCDNIGEDSLSDSASKACCAPSIKLAACDKRLCSLLIKVHSPVLGASFSNSPTCHSKRSRSNNTLFAFCSNSSRRRFTARQFLNASATALTCSNNPAWVSNKSRCASALSKD